MRRHHSPFTLTQSGPKPAGVTGGLRQRWHAFDWKKLPVGPVAFVLLTCLGVWLLIQHRYMEGLTGIQVIPRTAETTAMLRAIRAGTRWWWWWWRG